MARGRATRAGKATLPCPRARHCSGLAGEGGALLTLLLPLVFFVFGWSAQGLSETSALQGYSRGRPPAAERETHTVLVMPRDNAGLVPVREGLRDARGIANAEDNRTAPFTVAAIDRGGATAVIVGGILTIVLVATTLYIGRRRPERQDSGKSCEEGQGNNGDDTE